MLRIVFSPRWLVWHVLTLGAVVTCVLLGQWQLGRAEDADGTLQNFGYALQWPLFAVFFAFMWWRMLRLELRRTNEEQTAASGDSTSEPIAPATLPPSTARAQRPAPAHHDDDDPELAAYNRMLAELAARDQENRSA